MISTPLRSVAPHWLTVVAGRAATLRERLRWYLSGGPGSAHDPEAVGDWTRALGGPQARERRLAWLGWPAGQALPEEALGDPDYSQTELPVWTERLAGLVETVRTGTFPDEFRDPQLPLPFEEIHLTLGAALLQELSETRGWSRLRPSARRQLARRLAASLCEQSAPVLVRAFRQELARRDPLAAFDHEGSAASRYYYREFLDGLRQGGLIAVLTAYPVLARRLAEEFERQLTVTRELLERLDADADDLARHFQLDCSQVSELAMGMGDRHCGGRTVAGLRFADGRGLIYKPRRLGKEAAFAELAQEVGLTGLATLVREHYGWMERAEHRSCPDLAAAERCFERLGRLVALVHSVAGDDCHTENLMVAGEFPLVVDCETFAQGRVEAGEELEPSLLHTGFLPIWVPISEGRAYDASGLSGEGGVEMPAQDLYWHDINTDAMRAGWVARRSPYGANAVRVGERRLAIGDYLEPLCRGFATAYRELMERRPALQQPGSPLQALLDTPARFIVRPTRIYHNLLGRTHHPELLEHGLKLSIYLEELAQTYLRDWTELPGRLWESELTALEQLDVPYFEVPSRPSDTTLVRRCGQEVVEERLASLSEEGLEQHLDVLHLVWTDTRRRVPKLAAPSVRSGPRERFRKAALQLSEVFRSEQRRDHTWRTVVAAPERFRLLPAQTGLDLYSGSAGVAIFLAAAGHAGAATGELAASLLENAPPLAASGGMFEGLAGQIYAACRVADFTGRGELREQARDWARRLREVPAAHYDLGSGAAGRLLALLNVGEFWREEAAALAHCPLGELGGYAHGSAGVAAALARAGLDPQAALNHQRALACERVGTWQDLRADGTPSLAWCQGSSGVGLAALDAGASDLVEAALQAVLEESVPADACLCCGGLGGLDLLLEVGQVEEARRRAEVYLPALERGEFPLIRGYGRRICMGLFQGLAGLGYQMLRLYDPQAYPSLLRFR